MSFTWAEAQGRTWHHAAVVHRAWTLVALRLRDQAGFENTVDTREYPRLDKLGGDTLGDRWNH